MDDNKKWSIEKIRTKLEQAHEQENEFNKEMNAVSFQIKQLEIKKAKLARRISKNVKYRNLLISYL